MPEGATMNSFDITWTPRSGVPTDDQRAYARMMDQVRRRFADTGTGNDVLTIRVFTTVGSVLLFMSPMTGALLGFQTCPVGAAVRFFPLAPGFRPEPVRRRDRRQRDWRARDGRCDSRFEGILVDYNDLACHGAVWTTMRVGAATFEAAAHTLCAAPSAPVRRVAAAILQFAVGVGQAAQFPGHYERTVNAIGQGRTIPLNQAAHWVDWSTFVGPVRTVIDRGGTVLRVPVIIGSMVVVGAVEAGVSRWRASPGAGPASTRLAGRSPSVSTPGSI